MNINLRRYLVVLSLLVGSAIPCAANAYNFRYSDRVQTGVGDSVTSRVEGLHREIEEHHRVVGDFLVRHHTTKRYIPMWI